MEDKNDQKKPGVDEDQNYGRNANGGSMQQDGTDEASRLSDYPDGNTDNVKSQSGSIPEDQAGRPNVTGKSVAEATDPSKLSDI